MSAHVRYLGALALLLAILAFAPSATASPSLDSSVWSGEYYNNLALSGTPALLRSDASIDFFWPENTSPAPGYVVNSGYSVRWTRSVLFGATGNWTFVTVCDDGMRVYVDSSLVINAWYDQPPTGHTASIALTAGWHTVRVEYYNRMLGGTARVGWTLEGDYPNWKGEYYNNLSLSGTPTLVRNDSNIWFDWGSGSPAPSLPSDDFSVRWTRTLYFAAGTWRFTVTADDGVRLWVDGNLIVDKWQNQSATTYYGDIVLGAGNHTVRMEYYDTAVYAVARLSYTQLTVPPPANGVWRGQYYDNVGFSGTPVLVRDDPSLHFIWGSGSPAPSVPFDNFSVKWDSVQVLPTSGTYNVLVSSDDGVRVWVDNILVIDEWDDHAPTLFSTIRYFGSGAHNVHVEYYERSGGAMVGVDLLPTSAPTPAPTPSGDIIVDDRASGWQSGGSASSWRELNGGIGGHAFWTYNNASTAARYNWARWYPNLPRAGYYEVFAYIPSGIATSTSARYWVYHNGTYQLAARAQAFHLDQWMSLGTYYFRADDAEYVSLSDVTYECYLCRQVAFDAVKFTPR